MATVDSQVAPQLRRTAAGMQGRPPEPRDHFTVDDRAVLRHEHGLTPAQVYALEKQLDGVSVWLGPKIGKEALRNEVDELLKAAQTIVKFFGAEPADVDRLNVRWEVREEVLAALGFDFDERQPHGRLGSSSIEKRAQALVDGASAALRSINDRSEAKGYAAPVEAVRLVVEALREPGDPASATAAQRLDPVDGNASKFRELMAFVMGVATGREISNPRKIVNAYVANESSLRRLSRSFQAAE